MPKSKPLKKPSNPRLIARVLPTRRGGIVFPQRRWVNPDKSDTSGVAPKFQPTLLGHVPVVIPDRFTPSPHETYRLLGTRSPAFKAWFGDWEDERTPHSKVIAPDGAPQPQTPTASKVVHDSGKPIVVYHGSNSQFRAFDPSAVDEGCEYGPGFYFTDDIAVAEGVAGTDDPNQALGYRQRRIALEGSDRNAMCDALSDWVANHCPTLHADKRIQALQLLEVWRTLPTLGMEEATLFEQAPFKAPVVRMAQRLDLLNRGKTYSVFLNIRNPLDLSNAGQLQSFSSQVAPQAVLKPGETIDDLTFRVGGDFIGGKAREMGYDGLTFESQGVGGPCRVWVAFEPNQIKAVDNTGTFDGHQVDIFKALAKGEINTDLTRFASDGEPIYKLASTQVNLRVEDAARLIEWSKSFLSHWLAEGGIETEPHITVKYGLTVEAGDTATADHLAALFEGEGPIEARLGALGVFRTNEAFDVLYVSVVSTDLARLNAAIAAAMPCIDTHPTYTPHVTLAYLQKGAADQFEGQEVFEDLALRFDAMLYSGRSGWARVLPLGH